MPSFTTLNAVHATPTRISGGRVIPAKRFQLNAGSLKTSMTNIKPAEQMNTFATASSGLKMMITEARHKILTSLDLLGPQPAILGHQITSGPILTSSNAMVLPDRADQKLRWVKSVFDITGPAEMTQPVFRARQAGTAIDGSDLWTADLTLPVRQTRLVATQRQIDQMLARTPNLTFRDIPSTLSEATLKLPYTSPEGRRVMELQGKIAPTGDAVTFTFTGDAISLAYKLLRDTDDARVELLSDYTVFEPIETTPLIATAAQPATVAVSVGRLGALRRADLSSVFGTGIRRADISTRRRADVSRTRLSAKRFKKFKKNRIKGRAAILAAAQSAKMAQMKVAQTVTRSISYAKQRIVVNMVHTLDFRGTGTARLFVTKHAATGRDQVIRQPPWAHSTGPIRQIEPVDLRDLNLPDVVTRGLKIYASTVDVGVYHVVPSAYVLGREPETGRLQFHAEVISDPVNPQDSAVRVSIGLVPEISPTDTLHLRAALQRHLTASQPQGAADITLKMGYPTDLGLLPELVWGDQLSQSSAPVLDGQTVLLTITTKSLGFAKVLFDTLTTRGRILPGTLKFILPDDTPAQSSVLVGLTRTCGASASAHFSDATLHLNELAGHHQTLRALSRAGRNGSVEHPPLPAPILLAPDSKTQAVLPNFGDGPWVPDTKITYPEVVVLDPKRINVDEMTTPVIVTTALTQGSDFGGRGLQSFLIEIRLSGRAPIGITMTADVASGFFNPQILNLSVPLTSALAAGGRVLDYRIIAQFGDGTSQQTGWKTQNFGANPDITIRRPDLE